MVIKHLSRGLDHEVRDRSGSALNLDASISCNSVKDACMLMAASHR
jgi:hypothetical protein